MEFDLRREALKVLIVVSLGMLVCAVLIALHQVELLLTVLEKHEDFKSERLEMMKELLEAVRDLNAEVVILK